MENKTIEKIEDITDIADPLKGVSASETDTSIARAPKENADGGEASLSGEAARPKEKIKAPSFSRPEKAQIIGCRFVDEKDIIWYREDFFRYADGLWHLLDTESARAMIASDYIREWGPMQKNQIEEVIMFMKTRTYSAYSAAIEKIFKADFRDQSLNLKSGIFDLKTKTLRPYEKEDFAFHKLPFDYIENSGVPTEFYRLLTTSMGFEWNFAEGKPKGGVMKEDGPFDKDDFMKVMSFIQEWLGYSLLSGNRLHKNLIMFGSGRNGKGILQEVWSMILGDYNVSRLDIKHFNDPTMIIQTKNKLVNFSYDLDSGQQLDTGVIKAAAAGEWVTGRELYKNAANFRFTAKIVVACNELPYVRNMGPAVRERFFVLPFQKQFSGAEGDPDLKDKIIANELPLIFAWAVKGLTRLIERGAFDPPERCTIAAADYMADYDTIQQWIDEEGLDRGKAADRCKRSVLWKYFYTHCRENGEKYQKARFFSKLREKGYSLRNPGNVYYVYGLKPPNNASEDAY